MVHACMFTTSVLLFQTCIGIFLSIFRDEMVLIETKNYLLYEIIPGLIIP